MTRVAAIFALGKTGNLAKEAVPDLITLIQDPTSKVRHSAVIALAAFGKDAEQAIPTIVSMIANTKESIDNRTHACKTLGTLGSVSPSVDAVPTLQKVLENRAEDPRVRERIIWALRVHGEKLRGMKVYSSFVKVMDEKPTNQSRMLRYDCAYMLGMIWQFEAPEAALDVLLGFLKDDSIKIYSRTDVTLNWAENEKAIAAEIGIGDGRVMAVDALMMIGQERIRKRQDLVDQLEVLRVQTNYDALRKKIAVFQKQLAAPP